jgi:hypothetical protein
LAKHSSIRANEKQKTELAWTVAQIAVIWILSDIGYYFLLPWLGLKATYNDGPIAVTLYYTFWAGIAVIAFWPRYASWPQYARWATFGNRLTSSVVWTLAFTAGVLFVGYVLPALPPVNIREGYNPPELPLATPWYFLPKSIEILFQQLLVVALVLSLSAQRYSLQKISLACAALFGGMHILLAFGNVPVAYVIRFASLAAVFGFAFPYLLLRVPNGFAYSYFTHWSYYAITVIMARLLGPGTIPDFFKQLVGWS